MTTLHQRILDNESTIIAHRRHIHAHPELSFQEFETSKYIQAELQRLGIDFRVIATTGVVATIGSGDRCVALRADIDALPIVEETGLPFSSMHPGVMHACGHDSHTAMLLGAAAVLKSMESEIPGVVKLIFQPGEEKSPGGASVMIKEGVLENPRPEVIFGQHVNPDATVGHLEFAPDIMMASADELYWTLRGFGAHAAQPHKGKDPVVAAAELILHLQTLVSRQRNPLDAGVLSVTSIHGGSATNIIPDVVELKGTLRAFNDAWRWETLKRIEEHSASLCALHGVECAFEVVVGYPPLRNTPAVVEHAKGIAARIVPAEQVHDFEPKMWAEDFSFYAREIPAAFWMLGVRPPEQEFLAGLHNAKFSPDERAFVYGSEMMVRVALEWLGSKV